MKPRYSLFVRKHKLAYNSWHSMHSRCYNKSDKNYKYYGAREITVCKEWNCFHIFVGDMGDPPIDPQTGSRMTLDREDNYKGYYKDNCCWATKKEQTANKRIKDFIVEFKFVD